MKKLTLVLLVNLLFFSFSHAANEDLAKTFENYAQQTSKEIQGDVMGDIKKLSAAKLREAKDLDLIKNVILTLVKLDEEDPSRTAEMMLSPSYNKNKNLYKKAFKILKAEKKNLKENLEDIEALMSHFDKSGNG